MDIKEKLLFVRKYSNSYSEIAFIFILELQLLLCAEQVKWNGGEERYVKTENTLMLEVHQ